MDKFQLLLKNPILDSYHPLFEANYISNLLDYNFGIPEIKHKSFIFSCFALSIDGKLYYPDIKSGFSIANSNHHASSIEKNADLFTLNLARSISDAVILGTNSISNEPDNFSIDILDSKLCDIRNKHTKSKLPTTFVICRNLDNINFASKLFSDNEHQVVICCTNSQVNLTKLPSVYRQVNWESWDDKAQLNLKNLIVVNTLNELILKLYTAGYKVILNESPYFHHKLLQLKLLDEIWINYSGSYIGGNLSGLGGVQNPFESKNHPDCEILTLHSLGYNFLYTRQKILYS